MQSIIYAAGRGMRLGTQFEAVPKILLRFGGLTLLEWHVKRLLTQGISQLTIVTGFEHGRIKEEITRLSSRHPIRITDLHNRDFTEGSVLSFQTSIPLLKTVTEPVLLMDGDVLYPDEMLRRLIGSPNPSCLLIDRDYSTDDDDPVLVPIANGRPFDFVKQWRGQAEQVGESIGFFKIHPGDFGLLFEETHQRTTGAARADSYDAVLRALARAGRFGYEDVTGLPWTEIDFPKDVLRAEQEVLPAIQLAEAK